MLIRVKDLKDCLSKVMSGVSNDKQLPITSLLGIYISKDNNELMLRAYDGINVVNSCKTINFLEGDLQAVVNANTFNTLISKVDWDCVDLEIVDNSLVVNFGKNHYSFELAYEEDKLVEFPDLACDIDFNDDTLNKGYINAEDLKKIKDINGACLSSNKSLETYLLGAYCGKYVITTDNIVACFTNMNLFKGAEILMHPKTINLLKHFYNGVFYCIKDGIICLGSDDFEVYGSLMGEVVDYPVKDLVDLRDIATKTFNPIRVSKNDLVNSLSRLKLFINDLESDSLELNIYPNKLIIKGVDNGTIEEIALNGEVSDNYKQYFISCNVLLNQVKSCSENVLNITYDNDSFICIYDGSSVKVLATETYESGE